MHIPRIHTGNPPFVHVVRALEEAFGARFIRREWHEVGGDGRGTGVQGIRLTASPNLPPVL